MQLLPGDSKRMNGRTFFARCGMSLGCGRTQETRGTGAVTLNLADMDAGATEVL